MGIVLGGRKPQQGFQRGHEAFIDGENAPLAGRLEIGKALLAVVTLVKGGNGFWINEEHEHGTVLVIGLLQDQGTFQEDAAWRIVEIEVARDALMRVFDSQHRGCWSELGRCWQGSAVLQGLPCCGDRFFLGRIQKGHGEGCCFRLGRCFARGVVSCPDGRILHNRSAPPPSPAPCEMLVWWLLSSVARVCLLECGQGAGEPTRLPTPWGTNEGNRDGDARSKVSKKGLATGWTETPQLLAPEAVEGWQVVAAGCAAMGEKPGCAWGEGRVFGLTLWALVERRADVLGAVGTAEGKMIDACEEKTPD